MDMARAAPPPPPPETVLRGHSSGVQAICFLDQETLMSGDQDGLVKIWNLERRRVCAQFHAHSPGEPVLRLERFDNMRVVSQGQHGEIKVWDAERLGGATAGCLGSSLGGATPADFPSPQPTQSVLTGAFHFCTFALTRWRNLSTTFSPEIRHTVGEEGIAGVVQQHGERQNHSISGSSAHERGRGDHNDATALEGCEERQHADEADGMRGNRGKQEGDEEDGELNGIEGTGIGGGEESSASASFAANTVLAPNHDHYAVTLWDLRAKAPGYTITPADPKRRSMVMCTRLLGESPSSASPLALCGHDHGSLCVYDLRATAAEPLIDAQLHEKPLLCVDVGFSGKRGVSGSADNNIHVFKLNAQKGVCEVSNTFHLERPGTGCVEIRQDEKLFVSGGWDHRVRVYSWRKAPRPLAVLRSHDESVFSVAYSPRIGAFASSSKDCRIAVWNVFPERAQA